MLPDRRRRGARLLWIVRVAICSTTFAWLLTPSPLIAQDAAYFEVLSIPPRSIGTCVRSGGGDTTSARGSHLVVAGFGPNRRREIAILEGVRGTSFMDLIFRSTGSLSATGDHVVGLVDSTRRVQGFRQHLTVQMSDSGGLSTDTAGFREMRDRALRQSKVAPLDARAQRKVLRLVEWLRKRCPN